MIRFKLILVITAFGTIVVFARTQSHSVRLLFTGDILLSRQVASELGKNLLLPVSREAALSLPTVGPDL